MLVRGPLQCPPEPKKGVVNMMLAKAKRPKAHHFLYDGSYLWRFEDATERELLAKYQVLGTRRVSPTQLDVDVQTGTLSLKARTPYALEPWVEAMRSALSGERRRRHAALSTLEALQATFETLSADVLRLEEAAAAHDNADVEAKFRAKAELAQIDGKLDRLQFAEVDAVVTSDIEDEDQRAEAKASRKRLNASLDDLRSKVALIHANLVHATAAAAGDERRGLSDEEEAPCDVFEEDPAARAEGRNRREHVSADEQDG